MTPVELKLFEKVVQTLAEDPTIYNKVEGRVYDSHISSVDGASFPAISLTLLECKPTFEVPDLVQVTFQVDLWFPAKTTTATEMLEIAAQVRSLLHRAVLTDTRLGLKVLQIYEITSGPKMFESDTDLFHFPKRYMAEVV